LLFLRILHSIKLKDDYENWEGYVESMCGLL
jgi:hypothetical protein